MTNVREAKATLLYDGLCGFCDGTVQFVLARDRRHRIRFAPLQGEFARELFSRHRELASVDSLIVVISPSLPADGADDSVGKRNAAEGFSREVILTRSAAVIFLGRELGGIWSLISIMLQLIPGFVRDALYDVFARRRYRWFGRRESCRLPTVPERGRFID